MTSISLFPDEVLLAVFRCLDDVDLVRLSAVSKRFRRLSCDRTLWQRLYLQRWLSAPSLAPAWRLDYLKLVKAENYTARVMQLADGADCDSAASGEGVSAIAWPRADRCYAGLSQGHLFAVDLPSGVVRQRLRAVHHGCITSLACAGNAEGSAVPFLASAGRDPIVKIWKEAEGELFLQRAVVMNDGSAVRSVALSDDACLAFAAVQSHHVEQSIQVVDVERGAVLRAIPGVRAAVHCLSLRGSLLATGNAERQVILWDIRSDAIARIHRGHVQAVAAVDLDADGASCVSGSWDRTAKEWDSRRGVELRTLEAHSKAVLAVRCDRSKIVSGSDDMTLKEWSRRTSDWRTVGGHTGGISSIALLGKRTALSAATDGSLRLWTLYDM